MKNRYLNRKLFGFLIVSAVFTSCSQTRYGHLSYVKMENKPLEAARPEKEKQQQPTEAIAARHAAMEMPTPVSQAALAPVKINPAPGKLSPSKPDIVASHPDPKGSKQLQNVIPRMREKAPVLYPDQLNETSGLGLFLVGWFLILVGLLILFLVNIVVGIVLMLLGLVFVIAGKRN